MSGSTFKIEKIEKLPDSEAVISGEITIDFLNACRKDALKHLNSHLNLPGFRKGHIPEDVLVKNVGEGAILEETAEIAMGKEYGNIITASELRPITRPHVSITKLAPGIPLSFKMSLVIEPELELPDYKKIAKETKEEDPDKRKLAILENIVKQSKLDVPKKFLDLESTHAMQHHKEDVEKVGIKWEEYLKKIEKTEADLEKTMRDQIAERTKAEMVIGKIAEKENLKTYKDVFEFLDKPSTK